MSLFDINFQILSLICIVFFLILSLCKKNANYFKDKNVKFVKPNLLIFGYMFEVIFKRRHLNDIIQRYYNDFSNSRFFGAFEFWNPIYMIRDPEIIKQLGIKEFDNFTNHRSTIDEEIDNFFGKNLFMLNDQKWRDMRGTLSPAFTGSKMRHMFNLIIEISHEYMKEMKETVKTEKDMEFKDFSNRYAHDVIAKCAFGVSINSLKEPDNEFFKIGFDSTQFPIRQQLKFFGFSAFPSLMKFLKVKFFDDSMRNYFTNLVRANIEHREKNNVKIKDVINLLMEARKHGKIETENEKEYESAGFATVLEASEIKHRENSVKISKWSYEDITSQLFLFFIAGFDTVASAMTMLAYELSINPKVMQNLCDEISAFLLNLNGKLPQYEDIQKMEYLDMVVSESLRKWPPVSAIDRICNQATVIEDFDGTKVQIEKNDGVLFLVRPIHMDSNYYPDPEKFDPERFSLSNRENINPFTYLPFGVGPRNCIGNRFALMEIKAFFFSILSNFTIESCSKTEIPLKLKVDTFATRAKNGVWVKFRPRI